MTVKRAIVLLLLVGIIAGGIVGWTSYRRVRADYDAYRKLIQPGISVAGVPVGWRTPEEAREKVAESIAQPYYRDFVLDYQDQSAILSPGLELDLVIPVDEMVGEAVAASHQYDYWQGFWSWVRGEVETLEMDVPFRMAFDESAAGRFLEELAGAYDVVPVEPMVDVHALAFLPGSSGRSLEVEEAARLINESVPQPEKRAISLTVNILEPDQSRGRIESMLSTLGPVMEQQPAPPSFYTATVPLSTTGGLVGTPRVDYTGELTWTFPHFVSYTGDLTSTYSYFFQPGTPGSHFDVDGAVEQVEAALDAGESAPITFEPDPVPPPPITKDLLIPPLEERLARFPGVSSLLIKNLDSGELIYDSNVDYVLSGMSVVKIGIMVEVYRFYGGVVDAQTHQELVDMLGSESCNPCANRLLAALGGGSSQAGAQRVTNTMRAIGLANFRLCGPFRVVEAPLDGGPVLLASNSGQWLWQAQVETPRYDNCVRATPREMANLLEMIFQGTRNTGRLREMYPAIEPQAYGEMIDIMAANNLRNMLGAGIPADVKLAHKHGFAGYDVPWGDTRAEVGIIFSPGATWLISFYIWEDSPWINYGVMQPLYRDVSNMLYNYFNPLEPYWPLPPWTPPPDEA